METYPISLAIFDFVPTTAFLIGAFFLVKTGLICRGKPCSRMLMLGGLLIFLGGTFKAVWKLLFTAGIADIQWMSQGQFVYSSIGFLALFVSVLRMIRTRQKQLAGSPVLGIAAWKIPFLFLMTLTSLGAEGILVYLSFKRNVPLAAVGFAFGVLGILAMGALASADQTLTMQWVEESINAIGQLGFMSGSILLFRDFKAAGCPCEDHAGANND
jgi:hypothetical protein